MGSTSKKMRVGTGTPLGGLRRTQKEPERPRRSQKDPGEARRSQKEPRLVLGFLWGILVPQKVMVATAFFLNHILESMPRNNEFA